MFYNASKGCGKALPVKAFVQFLARASRTQNSWRDFFGGCFSWIETETAADLYSNVWAWGFNGVDKGFENVALRRF